MKHKILFIIAGGAAGLFIIILILFFITQHLTTTLEVTVLDAISKSWVYDSTIRIQNRVIRGFKSLSYTFKNIKTGKYLLSVSAPNYESKEIGVDIHGGKNMVKTPVELRGFAIPDLAGISVFENAKEERISLDIRLIGQNGEAIADHPCLPLKILLRISPQVVNNEYGVYEPGMKLERGKPLFFGEAEVEWNTNLTEIYRYSGSLLFSSVTATPAPYWIIDYLFLLPNPLKITDEEIEEVIEKIKSIENPDELTKYLDTQKDRMQYYISIKPNVENLFGGAK
jgi:hypothetical protein